ncbi:MAG TPA: hypothetical protein VMA09_16370 [Candidatus Binataceae bacterium]|nr:hypothetical protein [Candidatus Binataceae bacterium]
MKPEVWANAYYKGHIVLEQAIGNYVLGKATSDDLGQAWHVAQQGLPGVVSGTEEKA